MRNFKKPLIFISSFIVIALIVATFVYIKYLRAINAPLQGKGSTVTVVVKQGESLYDVFESLDKENSLKSLFATKYYIKKNKIGGDIQPGTYEILIGTSLDKIINLLREGGHNIKLTIPEGLNVEEIAARVEKTGLTTKDEFLAELKKYPLPDFVKENKDKRYQLEGFLFPDTYFFKKTDKSEDIILTMLIRFQQVMNQIKKETNISFDDSQYEDIINKASMIEKEARVDSDRPLIASVIENRLKINKKLEIDSTVLYAIGQHKDVVTYKDLEVKSPYNTYQIKGLPVGPICNPGEKSIVAAVKPEETKFLYYILQKNNEHYFTADYNDFLKMKKQLGY
ncbi:endolytic transglycosylase MltG [Clostridium manihotivorum]|uniref:Endolytic murein transglycosylase n=1 Tax=Clostridium manihotivorum TaxID=2320868 RepID=A0A3R5UAM6_9CLOT|nr:endolytic transglycosylase MltG [Clostridium manihotivorum]QAA33746.1 endolytic transglycosylase MltG [Clostridium manihotivorum]